MLNDNEIVEFREYHIFGVFPYSMWKDEKNKNFFQFFKENNFEISFNYIMDFPNPEKKLYGVSSTSDTEQPITSSVMITKDFGKNELDTVNAIISKIRGINTSIPACYIGKRTDYPDWATEPCYKNIALDDEYFRYPQIGIELSWCNTHFDGRDLTQKELNKVIKEMKRYYNRCIRFKHRDGRYLTIKDTFIKLQSAASDTIGDIEDDIKQPLSKEQDKYLNKSIVEFLIERKNNGYWL